MNKLHADWRMSPGLEANGFVFLTGFTGVDVDGSLSPVAVEQFEAAFRQVDMVLREAGLSFGDVVEMTSYHVGLRDHLDQFRVIRDRFVRQPHPAWTAIEVAGFATVGVVIELRAIARRP